MCHPMLRQNGKTENPFLSPLNPNVSFFCNHKLIKISHISKQPYAYCALTICQGFRSPDQVSNFVNIRYLCFHHISGNFYAQKVGSS